MARIKPQEDYPTAEEQRARLRVVPDAESHFNPPDARLVEYREMMKRELKIDMQFMTAGECTDTLCDMVLFVEALRYEIHYKRHGQ